MPGLENYFAIMSYEIIHPWEMIDDCGTPVDSTGLVSNACFWAV